MKKSSITPTTTATRAILLIILLSAFASGNLIAQNVAFDDAKFKKALLANKKINTNNDGEISKAEAKAYSGKINVSNRGIRSLKGIEEFVNITGLSCSFSDLRLGIDVTKNTKLTSLVCDHCGIKTLDVSKNTKLTSLVCAYNGINTLDVSKNINLSVLHCTTNQLTTLDVSKNTELKSLDFTNNKLTALDVSKNINLTTLFFSYNQLSTLDVSKNTQLTSLNCGSNKLKIINLKNGNNDKLRNFDATTNPDLNCLQVDDVATFKKRFKSSVDPQKQNTISNDCTIKINSIKVASKTNVYTITKKAGSLILLATVKPTDAFDKSVKWSVSDTKIASIKADKDNQAVLTAIADGKVTVTVTTKDGSNKSATKDITITDQKVVDIPDPEFKRHLIDHHNIDKNGDKYIQVSEAKAYDGAIKIHTGNKEIKSLKGLAAFTALTNLVINNIVRKFILTPPTLDLSSNSNLTYLELGYSNITSLDISSNTKLNTLVLQQLQIKELDLSKHTNITEGMEIRGNESLTTIDIKNGANTKIKLANIVDNVKLTCLQVDDPEKFKKIKGNRDATALKTLKSDCTVKVASISVQGKDGVSKITDLTKPLQMIATVKPDNAFNKSISWTVDNSSIATIDKNGLLKGLKNGKVVVTATSKYQPKIKGFTTIMIGTITNIEDFEGRTIIAFYPNPATDRLSIETDHTIKQVTITDLTGKTIISLENDLKSIDISSLEPNMYILRIRTQGEELIEKFVKN